MEAFVILSTEITLYFLMIELSTAIVTLYVTASSFLEAEDGFLDLVITCRGLGGLFHRN